MAVHIIDGFLDAATCRRVRRAMDAGAVEPGAILDVPDEVDTSVRRVDLVEVDATTRTALERRLDDARDVLARQFGRPLGDREGIGFLRYPAGGHYLPHVDRAPSVAWPAAALRQVAVVVFLNDDFTGGWLHVIEDGQYVEPRAGRLAAFDAGLLHEVEAVRHGVRDVAVDWFY